MADEKPKLSARDSVLAVMEEVKSVGKNGRNEQQGFNFRGIDAVVNAAGPVMRKVGAFTSPTVLSREVEHGVSKNGTQTTHVFLEVAYDWYGTDGGEPLRGIVYAEALDTSDKATAKAMSVAKRTFLIQVLELPTDEPDPDSDYIEQKPASRSAEDRFVLVAEWLEAFESATSLGQLQAAWEGAGKAGITKDRDVIAAKDAAKARLTNA